MCTVRAADVDGGSRRASSVFSRADSVANFEPDAVANSFAHPKPNPQPYTGSGFMQFVWLSRWLFLRCEPGAGQVRALCRWPVQRVREHIFRRKQQHRHRMQAVFGRHICGVGRQYQM